MVINQFQVCMVVGSVSMQRSPDSLHHSKVLAPSARKPAPGVSKIAQSGSGPIYNQPGQ